MGYKTTSVRNFRQSNNMSHKLVVFLCLLVAALAEKPRLGLRIPILGEPEIGGHIVGGSEAQSGQFPHIVSLQWGAYDFLLSHFCAGSIINERWVVTAGHCILAVPNSGKFVVKAGKHSLPKVESTEQQVDVERTIVHPKYSGGVAPYDIALIKLKSPLKMNKNVAPINLPRLGSEPTGKVLLSGWGSVSKTSFPIMPDELQWVEMPIVDRPTCKNAVEALTGPSPLHQTNICTGPLTGGVSACSGDSGGPLIQVDLQGRKELVGVVSWGIIPCGSRGAPSVYVKASDFTDWVNENMK